MKFEPRMNGAMIVFETRAGRETAGATGFFSEGKCDVTSKPAMTAPPATPNASQEPAAHPAAKGEQPIFYQGHNKYKPTPSGHAFYDPTQGGFTKRWVAPRA